MGDDLSHGRVKNEAWSILATYRPLRSLSTTRTFDLPGTYLTLSRALRRYPCVSATISGFQFVGVVGLLHKQCFQANSC